MNYKETHKEAFYRLFQGDLISQLIFFFKRLKVKLSVSQIQFGTSFCFVLVLLCDGGKYRVVLLQ